MSVELRNALETILADARMVGGIRHSKFASDVAWTAMHALGVCKCEDHKTNGLKLKPDFAKLWKALAKKLMGDRDVWEQLFVPMFVKNLNDAKDLINRAAAIDSILGDKALAEDCRKFIKDNPYLPK